MMDSEDNECPQRHSALAAKELARWNIDIAALSEVRFANQGSLTEHGTGYTLYWSGKTKEERRLSGVGFMMKTQIANRLQSLPIGHSYRLMSFRLPIQGNRFATLISVYAPTLLADAEVKEAFYSDLRKLLQQVKSEDKVLILGGNCNNNGCLLLEFCSEYELTITNTMFQQKDRYTSTTTSLPDSTT